MKVIAVTGTGTDIGKTIVTAALASCAQQSGDRVAVVKPIQTGVAPAEPGDLTLVERLTGCSDLFEFVRYDEPLAPATAARRLGEPGPTMADLAEQLAALAASEEFDVVLLEGAGGALVQFNQSGETFLDLLSELGEHGIGVGGRASAHRLEIVLVTSAGLGALHQVAATAMAMVADSCGPSHLVIGSWPDRPGLAERCNLEDFLGYEQGSARFGGAVPAGAGELSPDDFAALAMRSLTPALSGSLNAGEFFRTHRAPPPLDRQTHQSHQSVR